MLRSFGSHSCVDCSRSVVVILLVPCLCCAPTPHLLGFLMVSLCFALLAHHGSAIPAAFVSRACATLCSTTATVVLSRGLFRPICRRWLRRGRRAPLWGCIWGVRYGLLWLRKDDGLLSRMLGVWLGLWTGCVIHVCWCRRRWHRSCPRPRPCSWSSRSPGSIPVMVVGFGAAQVRRSHSFGCRLRRFAGRR